MAPEHDTSHTDVFLDILTCGIYGCVMSRRRRRRRHQRRLAEPSATASSADAPPSPASVPAPIPGPAVSPPSTSAPSRSAGFPRYNLDILTSGAGSRPPFRYKQHKYDSVGEGASANDEGLGEYWRTTVASGQPRGVSCSVSLSLILLLWELAAALGLLAFFN